MTTTEPEALGAPFLVCRSCRLPVVSTAEVGVPALSRQSAFQHKNGKGAGATAATAAQWCETPSGYVTVEAVEAWMVTTRNGVRNDPSPAGRFNRRIPDLLFGKRMVSLTATYQGGSTLTWEPAEAPE